MKDITLTVTITEGNGILAALGKLPYEQSAALIHKLQMQAQLQVKTIENAVAETASETPG